MSLGNNIHIWCTVADSRLQNMYLVCRHAEKTLQLLRLLQRESRTNEAAKFIVYFSTCAAVDYFYRVSDFLQGDIELI